MKLDSNNHSVFLLHYHLVLVVKYRREVFTDEISDFAKEAVKEMQMAGILEGDGSGVFKPLNNATRAEAAKIIYMLAEAMQWRNTKKYLKTSENFMPVFPPYNPISKRGINKN